MSSEIELAESDASLLRQQFSGVRRETAEERRHRLQKSFVNEWMFNEFDDMDRPAAGAPDVQVAGPGFHGSLPHQETDGKSSQYDPHWQDIRAVGQSGRMIELPPLGRTLASEAGPSRQLATQMNLDDSAEPLPSDLLYRELARTGGTAVSLTREQQALEDENSINYIRKKQLSVKGTFVALLYFCALVFYMGVRIRFSLQGLGQHMWYGVLLMIMEMFGAIGMMFSAVVMVWKPVMEPYLQKDDTVLRRPLRRPYIIRVLIPCYKESLNIVQNTVEAVAQCHKPLGVELYIYICDDGRDDEKRRFVNTCNMPNVFYFSGRRRARGEMNGKSCNLNNALMLIYGKCAEISLSEIVCILDADQVAASSFIMKTLPVMDFGDNIALVLTPQAVFNVPSWKDIFNHGNIHFWEVLQPGYDAVGFISCSGTNMLLRARALKNVGWFPTDTLTEDWSLGMEFRVKNWEGRYVNEYLCMGEAPLEVRNAFQQRSRWCKGHFQVFFTKQCPLFNPKLNFYMRVMFSSTIFTYLAAGIVTPFLHLVPLITIWTGLMPLVFNLWVVISLTTYYIMSNLVLYHSMELKKLFPLWYSTVSTNILWYAYLKAAVLSILRTLLGKLMSFKATAKGRLGVLSKISFQDLWIHMVLVALSVPTIIVGIVNLNSIKNLTILIALCWVAWNMLPSILILYYAMIGCKGTHFTVLCLFSYFLAQTLPLLALILLWMLYPRNVDYADVSHKVLSFLDAQWSGYLPGFGQPLVWRRSSVVDDGVILGGANYSLAGGYYTGSLVGHAKLTKNIAYTITMLAWTSLTFRKGVKNANIEDQISRHIKWGIHYLERTFIEHPNNIRNHTIVAVLGNCSTEHLYWGRPEDMDHARPAQMVAAYQKPADLTAQMAAAFVSSSIYLYRRDPRYSAKLYRKAIKLYNISTNFKGLYTDIDGMSDVAKYYPSSSYFDDLAWAAAWMFFASNEEDYYKDAVTWLDRHIYKEVPLRELENTESHYFNMDNMLWATNTLLFQAKPNIHRYREAARLFLNTWVCQATYTGRGRAFWPLAPTLGETANAALLAMMYSAQYRYDSDDPSDRKYSRVYDCYARGQVRYMLGYDTALLSFVVGNKMSAFGQEYDRYPKRVQHRAASCKSGPSLCTRENAFDVATENPHLLMGALVEGPPAKRINSLVWKLSDKFEDKRYLNGSRVSLEGNMGLMGIALAGAQVNEIWARCLGGYGVLNTKHPIC